MVGEPVKLVVMPTSVFKVNQQGTVRSLIAAWFLPYYHFEFLIKILIGLSAIIENESKTCHFWTFKDHYTCRN